MIYGVLESLMLPPIMQISKLSFDKLIINPEYNFIAFIPILIIAIVMLWFIVKKDIILYDLAKNMKNRTWLIIVAILIQTLFLLLINISIIASDDLSSFKKGIPYINLGLVTMCIFNIIAIKQLETSAKHQAQHLLLKNHLKQIENVLQSMSTQQHEYARHMQTLQALIELNKIDKASEYIDGITNNYWSNNIIYHIDNPAISSLINCKSNVAQFNNINFAVAVKCNLADIHIPAWDLCSILGNLLDNAIEAAAIDPQPRVGVEFKYENGFYVIYINNNGSLIKEPSRIFEAGYTTKGSEGRGYGLYIAKKLIHKYNGEIKIINKPKTTIILKLPGEGVKYDKFNILKYS